MLGTTIGVGANDVDDGTDTSLIELMPFSTGLGITLVSAAPTEVVGSNPRATSSAP